MNLWNALADVAGFFLGGVAWGACKAAWNQRQGKRGNHG